MSVPYRPGPSAIHGTGIMATRLIRAGEEIPMPDIDYYDVFLGFNHSCNNNLGNRSRDARRIALRDIHEGEELTVDYGNTAFLRGKKCNCEHCRG